MTFDFSFHTAELITLSLISWRVIVAVNRLTNVFREYPPHKHSPSDVGEISYPVDFEPGKVTHSKAKAAANATD